MWQKFTQQARQVVFVAQEEAQRLGTNHVATEHLLLGLIRVNDNIAGGILKHMSISLDDLSAAIERQITRGDGGFTNDMQLTSLAKRVIDLAFEEALKFKVDYIGTEHLLVGLLLESEGLAGRLLAEFGIELGAVRREVSALHSDTVPEETGSVSGQGTVVSETTVGVTRQGERRIMWQRFTERARRVVFFAQEEAGRLGENYVSTEHLLLGILRENDSVASRILTRMEISLGRIRNEIERQVTRGDGRLQQDMQLTPRAKRVIDLAYDEARQLNNNYIGTEHLLLALIREGDGLAGRVLQKLGVELERTRHEILQLQDNDGGNQTHRAAQLLQNTRVAELKQVIDNDVTKWRRKNLLSLMDVTAEQFRNVLEVAAGMKALDQKRQPGIEWSYPRTLGMIFEKPSLRTRVSFEASMVHLKGHAIYLAPGDVGLGHREPAEDVAGVLSRWVDVITARVFAHETVEELAAHSESPIINALSDREHPLQAFADLLTLQEHKGDLGNHLKLAYVGDGNNVLHALLLACAKLGIHISAACPEGYEPSAEYVSAAQTFATETGATVEITTGPAVAVANADAVYTDVWASMGQEAEKEERAQIFAAYQINADLMQHAKPDAIVLHCLPAHRGEEISADIMTQHKKVILDQAENRLHTQKALLALIVGL
jgi:ornithine carbamoyltransferase